MSEIPLESIVWRVAAWRAGLRVKHCVSCGNLLTAGEGDYVPGWGAWVCDADCETAEQDMRSW